jgi:hypothetical protein
MFELVVYPMLDIPSVWEWGYDHMTVITLMVLVHKGLRAVVNPRRVERSKAPSMAAPIPTGLAVEIKKVNR